MRIGVSLSQCARHTPIEIVSLQDSRFNLRETDPLYADSNVNVYNPHGKGPPSLEMIDEFLC